MVLGGRLMSVAILLLLVRGKKQETLGIKPAMNGSIRIFFRGLPLYLYEQTLIPILNGNSKVNRW
jgi:hypothetical protein